MTGTELVVFGSLPSEVDKTLLADVRRNVATNAGGLDLHPLLRSLPDDYDHVLSKMPDLTPEVSSARELLCQICDILTGGRPLDISTPLPNHCLIPLSVLKHITDFAKHFDQTSFDEGKGYWSQGDTPTTVLGLCTGMLSAYTVACADSSTELQRLTGPAIRLAMVIGLVVDRGGPLSVESEWTSVSVAPTTAKSQHTLNRLPSQFPDTYISVYYDKDRVTLTTPLTERPRLIKELRSLEFKTLEISIKGQFHSPRHSTILQQLTEFCDKDSRFQFGEPSSLVRVVDTSGSSGNSLHARALEEILTIPSRWYQTISNALHKLDGQILSFGPEHSLPQSILSQHAQRTQFIGHKATIIGEEAQSTTSHRYQDSDIAVVGMACNVPGAGSLPQFWELLLSGSSQHRQIDGPNGENDRFSFSSTPFRPVDDTNAKRSWYANMLDNYAQFDHKFFGKSARESASMDPQQRQFMQTVYHAVEVSGYFNDAEAERNKNVGCFVGACLCDYEKNVASHPANAFTSTGNLRGFLAGKVSHFFGWTGPALVVDTACSSSLVAIYQACNAITSGECDAAVAGGSHIMTAPDWFQNLAASSFLSPTGQCKPFDADADGYCRGEGVGAIFLKRLDRAMNDGNPVFGIIAATAVQQNENHTPIFAPNQASLTKLFTKVVASARIEPAQVSVVEAHGTGTPLGDPSEWKSIRQALAGDKRRADNKLVVSSVKGLIGHSECTSGVLGLIKILLMLNKTTIPPQASFRTLKPSLDASPADNMVIPTQAVPWMVGFRVALLNNYGASGSNASAVIIQPPARYTRMSGGNEHINTTQEHLFKFRALDSKALQRYIRVLRRIVERHDVPARELSSQLARQANKSLKESLTISAKSTAELCQQLEAFDHDELIQTRFHNTQTPSMQEGVQPRVVLCFGGQTSSFVGLDEQLYRDIGLFRKHLDDVDSELRAHGWSTIFPAMFQSMPLDDICQLHAAVFALQYACAKCWIASGVTPSALVGHSFGELTALCISGTLSLKDALALVVGRARIIQEEWVEDRGGMLAFDGPRKLLEEALSRANENSKPDSAAIACYNSDRSFTVSGSTDAIAAVERELSGSSVSAVRSRRLDIAYAYHSHLVDPVLKSVTSLAKALRFEGGTILIEHSTQSAMHEVPGPCFVSQHMRDPVYFQHALKRLADRGFGSDCIFLEAGSDSKVTVMAARALSNRVSKSNCEFQEVNIANGCRDAWNQLTQTTLSLMQNGLQVEHWTHHKLQSLTNQNTCPALLPPYQFDPESRHDLRLLQLSEATSTAPKTSKRQLTPPLIVLEYGAGTHDRPAVFRVNQDCEAYYTVTNTSTSRHLPLATNIAIYSSLIKHAFSLIQPSGLLDSGSRIEQVVASNPITDTKDMSLRIEIAAHHRDSNVFSFTMFSSHAMHDTQQQNLTHLTGSLSLWNTTDLAFQRLLLPLERLMSFDSAMAILNCSLPNEIVSTRNFYRLLSGLDVNDKQLQCVQKIVSQGDKSAAVVRRQFTSPRTESSGSHGSSRCDDAVLDIGLFCVNFLANQDGLGTHHAIEIDTWIQKPEGAETRQADLIVLVMYQPGTTSTTNVDLIVYESQNRSLLQVILGAKYVQAGTVPKPSRRKAHAGRDSQAASMTTSASGYPDSIAIAKTGSQEHRHVCLTDSEGESMPTHREAERKAEPQGSMSTHGAETTRDTLKAVIGNLVGLDVAHIEDNSDLADLGIDSLTTMELTKDIEQAFAVKLERTDLLGITELSELVFHIDRATKKSNAVTTASSVDGSTNGDSPAYGGYATTPYAEREERLAESMDQPHNRSLQVIPERDDLLRVTMDSFDSVKVTTDSWISKFGQTRYMSHCLPAQNRLAVALIVETLEHLGAGIRQSRAGSRLTRITHIDDCSHLVTSMYRILEAETQILIVNNGEITRTAVPVPELDSHTLFEDILGIFPDHAVANRLLYHVGTKLAEIVNGETTGVRVVFGDDVGRELVSAFYASWPLNLALYAQLEAFVISLLQRLQSSHSFTADAPLRIMEMGGGTGGTTKRLIGLLATSKVPCEYTFTDLAPSFVATARKTWATQYPFMKFRVHDISDPPDADMRGSQHLVVASNAVHATQSLLRSTSNIRNALHPTGCLLLLEMTQPLCWGDLIFGVFEGWWLFDDGRHHALADATTWDSDLRAAGFNDVRWTYGHSAEAAIQRLIIASIKSVDTKIDDVPIHKHRHVNDVSIRSLPQHASREEAISRLVKSHTTEFSRAIRLEVEGADRSKQLVQNASHAWVVITGGTGGLGSHVVAAMSQREGVARVICLNRRGRLGAQERQLDALRTRGIHLPADSASKIHALEVDLSQPRFGLSMDQYTELTQHTTHIIHNAWLMNVKWPIKRFEPHLRIMANMLEFAREASVQQGQDQITFQFVSSMATVASHPLWTGSPMVLEQRVPVQSVLYTGYAEAKYVCERMLDATLQQYPDRFRTSSVRVGQISGSRGIGQWSITEHIPFLVKSSQTIGALPDIDGTLAWIAPEDAAGTLADLLLLPNDMQMSPVYHIDNPLRQSWRAVISLLGEELRLPSSMIGIPFAQWLARIRSWPDSADNAPDGANPAFVMADFFEEHFTRSSCGGLLLATTITRKSSPTLRGVVAIDDESIRSFVRYWKDVRFLN